MVQYPVKPTMNVTASITNAFGALMHRQLRWSNHVAMRGLAYKRLRAHKVNSTKLDLVRCGPLNHEGGQKLMHKGTSHDLLMPTRADNAYSLALVDSHWLILHRNMTP